MDKVKNFLERYVEWLAVALGVAFLGWTIYGYVLDKPVSSAVGSTPSVSPADIDPMVWEGPGETIKHAIDDKTTPPPMGPVVDYPHLAQEQFNKVSPSVQAVFAGPYTPLTPLPEQNTGTTSVAHNGIAGHVTQLPNAAALTNLAVSEGHSNVPAPVPPAAAGAPQPMANPATAVDLNWRSIGGAISVAELAKSFAACKIPEVFSNTAILRVTLIRQEREGSGAWGPETEIAPLENNTLQPLPANDSAPLDQKAYFEWAETNVEAIAAPKFYNVLQGDIWYPPGTKNPNQVDVAVVDDGFDPKNPGAFKGSPNSLTPDEKKELDDYNAKQAKQKAARQKGSNNRSGGPPQMPPGFFPGGGGPPGGPGGRGSPDAPDPDRERNSNNAPIPGVYQGGPPGMMPPGMMPPGMMPPGMMPPQGPGNVDTTNATLPKGSFSPASQANINIWAHDVTVQPGRTYRYKLRYILSNPVARTMGLCVPQSLAQQFYIVSPDSAWTDPVSVESDTNFYAVDTKHGVRFDIFKWKNGIYQMQTVQVNPGDMVGTADSAGNTTDFTTHWTLVDVREDPRDETNKTIVLVSDNGTVLKKELVIDQHSAAYRRLLEQANANKDKTAAAAPGTPPG